MVFNSSQSPSPGSGGEWPGGGAEDCLGHAYNGQGGGAVPRLHTHGRQEAVPLAGATQQDTPQAWLRANMSHTRDILGRVLVLLGRDTTTSTKMGLDQVSL